MTDVTDATFEAAVLNRSQEVPVVVDLWAPWCGPCKTLGPMLERAVAATEGAVELTKVNVDENPQVAASFNVQSIPAVFAISGAKVVDSFIGALPEAEVNAFIQRLAPAASEVDLLVAAGDEASLQAALEIEPGHTGAITGLARISLEKADPQETLALLAKVPETPETRALAAQARLAIEGVAVAQGEVGATLDGLLERVKNDDAARQEFVDILETLGPDDPLTAQYRKALAARLY